LTNEKKKNEFYIVFVHVCNDPGFGYEINKIRITTFVGGLIIGRGVKRVGRGEGEKCIISNIEWRLLAIGFGCWLADA
jgi:hypothetical protein